MAPSIEFHGQFGDGSSTVSRISSLFDSEKFSEVTVVVAWAKFSGLARLEEAIRGFRDRGGKVKFIVGIDEGGATAPGLRGLIDLATEAFVYHDPAGGTFHPKVYFAEGPHGVELVVGSSNLTAGGLYSNVEASQIVKYGATETEHGSLDPLREFIEDLLDDPCCIPLSEELVVDLHGKGMIGGTEARGRAGKKYQRQSKTAAGFAASNKKRATPPPLSPEARKRLSDLEIPDEPNLETVEERVGDGSTSAVETWSKELPQSDAQTTIGSTNPTGVMRLTQSGHPIDHRTWFRETFFGDLVDWRQERDSQGNRIEVASVPFTVVIDGTSEGNHVLRVTHAKHRESGQNNVTTTLHWGSLIDELQSLDRTGHVARLEQLEDGTFRLTIDSQSS